MPKKNRGHQRGKPGVSHHDKPGDNRMAFAAAMCWQCGRTDLQMLRAVQKLVRKKTEGNFGLTPFLYSTTPGVCPDCCIRTDPETDSVRGTSLCGRIRASVLENRTDISTRRMKTKMANEHGVKISVGAIFNCISATAADINREVMEIRSRSVVLERGDGRPFRSPVRPPPEPPENRYARYDSLLARYGTVWTMSRPLPAMVQILETSTMDPWSQTDESGHKIGKDGVQALIHNTSRATLVSIAENRKRGTLYQHAAGLAYRPMLHDGNRDNMRLRGWQPPEVRQSAAERKLRRMEWAQEVHQFDWVHVIRNVESVAMKQEGFDTPAHAALDMLRNLYRSAKDAAKEVTEMAGGRIRSASDTNRVFRMPGVLKYARGRVAELEGALDRIIAGCGNAEVSSKLANAAPYLFVFIYYSGMPPHNNGAELIVRT